jgi:hypothetical protein
VSYRYGLLADYHEVWLDFFAQRFVFCSAYTAARCWLGGVGSFVGLGLCTNDGLGGGLGCLGLLGCRGKYMVPRVWVGCGTAARGLAHMWLVVALISCVLPHATDSVISGVVLVTGRSTGCGPAWLTVSSLLNCRGQL